mmetsp:Transcript_9555/g.18351  ORF Transcript_9555/g.18351 Transcript_9555/m.18351 type:complete len:313 (-) Transcript_9555:2853-3791(-)
MRVQGVRTQAVCNPWQHTPNRQTAHQSAAESEPVSSSSEPFSESESSSDDVAAPWPPWPPKASVLVKVAHKFRAATATTSQGSLLRSIKTLGKSSTCQCCSHNAWSANNRASGILDAANSSSVSSTKPRATVLGILGSSKPSCSQSLSNAIMSDAFAASLSVSAKPVARSSHAVQRRTASSGRTFPNQSSACLAMSLSGGPRSNSFTSCEQSFGCGNGEPSKPRPSSKLRSPKLAFMTFAQREEIVLRCKLRCSGGLLNHCTVLQATCQLETDDCASNWLLRSRTRMSSMNWFVFLMSTLFTIIPVTSSPTR